MTLLHLISQDVQLRQRGREWWGCCPFHDEKTPSFSVNPEKGVYSCFGCGAKGDTIEYLRRKRGLSFRDAAKLAGKELPESERERQARERAVKERLLFAYYSWYHRKLQETCDLYLDLDRERDIAEVAFWATERVPELYTEEERDYWAEFLEALYTLHGYTENELDILTYNSRMAERFAWWEGER